MNCANIAYGTYRLRDKNCYDCVRTAIKVGYKIIDTASLYKNHIYIKDAIRDAIINKDIKREDIFVISKIHNRDQLNGKVYEACKEIINELEYVDLILLHSPIEKCYIESWKELIKAKEDGLIKYIGVSNFNKIHLTNIIKYERPYLNQVEMSVIGQQTELINFCKENNIIFQAHSIFTNNKYVNEMNILMKNGVNNLLLYEKIILWCLKMNISIVIGTSDRNHMINNLEISKKIDMSITFTDFEKYNINKFIYSQYKY